MNLRNELTLFLKELEQQNSHLSVRWDAGGDEVILRYFVDEEEEDYSNDLLYRYLSDHLTLELDLSTAGEHFNHGKGEIYLGFNEQPCIRYDEFVYEFDYEEILNFDETYGIPSRLSLPTSAEIRNKLSKIGVDDISLSVFVRLFQERIIKYFENGHQLLPTTSDLPDKQKLLKQMVEQVSEEFLRSLHGDTRGLMLSFELSLAKKLSRIDRVKVRRIIPQKDNEALDVLLF